MNGSNADQSNSESFSDIQEPKRYYGKHRGIVTNNVDPLQMGRIQALVPDVSNVMPSSWAMPCLPVAGIQMGFFTVPPVGSGVWIEFEQGDPDFPIWVGCYWGGASELPALAKTIPPSISGIAIGTTQQNGLVISDVPGPSGGVMLRSPAGASIIVNDTGIYIQTGKGASIVMSGSTVTINEGALEII